MPAPFTPTRALTVLEEALLVQHGDGIHAQQGRLHQGVQRKGHSYFKLSPGPTDFFPDTDQDVAPPLPESSTPWYFLTKHFTSSSKDKTIMKVNPLQTVETAQLVKDLSKDNDLSILQRSHKK